MGFSFLVCVSQPMCQAAELWKHRLLSIWRTLVRLPTAIYLPSNIVSVPSREISLSLRKRNHGKSIDSSRNHLFLKSIVVICEMRKREIDPTRENKRLSRFSSSSSSSCSAAAAAVFPLRAVPDVRSSSSRLFSSFLPAIVTLPCEVFVCAIWLVWVAEKVKKNGRKTKTTTTMLKMMKKKKNRDSSLVGF